MFTLLALGGYFVLRTTAQRSYQRHRQLTDFSLFLLCTTWGLFFSLPSLYAPYNWAWSWSNEVAVGSTVRLLSSILIIGGLAGLVFSILWLGITHSTGHESSRLRTSGPYRFTRNPQILTGTLIVLGYTILRPSWYATGWLILFAILTRSMVASEEEHLRSIYGEEYERYWTRTPRYIYFR